MINTLKKILESLGGFVTNHLYIATALIIILTVFSGIGITKIYFQSDLDEMNPQNLEIIQLNNRINSYFSDQESTLILIELEPSDIGKQIDDIRDPKVINFLSTLKSNLRENQLITQVNSISDFYPASPSSLEESKQILSQIPQSENFIGEGKDWTILFIQSEVGANEEKIRQLNSQIEDTVLNSEKPAGIKTTVTGTPALIAVMFNFLISDAIFTLIIAAILIFILIIIIEKSLSKSIVVMLPLLFGLTWTLGFLGWVDIPITIGTAGISAMLLGLGVEYSIFLFSRYEEEKTKMSSKEAIKKALSTTGAATVSSGMTTVIGFAVLTLSIFPVLSDMGASLAMGIALILTAVMFTSPVIILYEDKFIKPKKQKQHKEGKLKSIFEKYGNFASNHPFIIVAFGILVTTAMFIGLQNINSEEVDFDTVLPEDLEQLTAFQTITNERGDTSSVNLFVEINSEEIKDIREQEAIEYIQKLSKKAKYLSYVESVNSISLTEEQSNSRLLSSFSQRREFYNKLNTEQFLTNDFSGSLIQIQISEQGQDNQQEVTRQINELIQNTEQPAGLKVSAAGEIIVNQELNSIIGPDSSTTALYAFIGIIFLLLILSRSIKYTLLPLLTVVLGVIWTLGLVGFSGVPFNSITSSVLTMTIGIGIDFGLQLSMRYRQDRETMNKKDSMKETLKHTLYPMIITVIAALIGFRAMSFGNLKMMADLGTTMSFAITSSMIAAVTLVAGLMLIFDRKDKFKNKN